MPLRLTGVFSVPQGEYNLFSAFLRKDDAYAVGQGTGDYMKHSPAAFLTH